MNQRRYRIVLLFPALLLLFLGLPGATSPISSSVEPQSEKTGWRGNYAEGWDRFKELLSDQRNEEASSLAGEMLEEAIREKNGTEWTRCLVRYTALRISLHGYETAVRFLKEQPWPDDRMSVCILNLFYAHSLETYAQRYSYEIRRRENMGSKDPADLKTWTREQIFEEAQKAYDAVWENRRRLGELSNSEWTDYLVPNTYPEGIRPTLRDAVSYLWVAMLADTGSWQPAQLNELYKLDRSKLAGDSPEPVSLTDPDVHPLEKICFILSDLESWHLAEKNREAALEARLERFRQLHNRLNREEDRKYIRENLETYLSPLRDLPWWSEGMAQLAEFVRSDYERGDLIRARDIALEGEKGHPESGGGLHCGAIVESIEAPDYNLSGMENDNPGKRSILVTHKNLDTLYFRAYAIDLVQTIERSNDYNLLPSGRELEALIKDSDPDRAWEVDLPETPDYKTHDTYVIPPMTDPATYLIVASARPGFTGADNRLQCIYMTVGDMVLLIRDRRSQMEVTVLSGAEGKPVSGADVDLYLADYRRGHRKMRSERTDDRGIVEFPVNPTGTSYFLLAQKDNQKTFSAPQYHSRPSYSRQRASTLIYTDRSIYRPGQKILWKAVYYSNINNGGEFTTVPSSIITIDLKDRNNQTVASQTVTTNDFGTASGEFVIPSGHALGMWGLESSPSRSRTTIRVEEYKRPTFEAELLDPEKPLQLNRPAQLKGEVRYYFGLPVTNGEVQWRVRRDPVYFGRWWSILQRYSPQTGGSQTIGSGTESLDADGSFTIGFLPEADERGAADRRITYRYTVSADVTDEGGETRSVERSFILGYISVRANARLDRGFFLENDPVAIHVSRTDLDGNPRAGKAQWSIVALKEPPQTLLPAEQPIFAPPGIEPDTRYETPGDRQRPRMNPNYNPDDILMQWANGEEQATGTLEHDNKGQATVSIDGLPAGAYRLLYTTADASGEEYELQQEFIVASPALSLPLPAIFAVENSGPSVGETARFLVHSGLEDQFMVFEAYKGDTCIRREELISGRDPSIVEIPITEEDRGALAFTLTLLRDNQWIAMQRTLSVPWDNKQLEVEFSTFRDRLQPGQKETWSVHVTGPEGKDIAVPAAELLAYMYDRSLDDLYPHSFASPLSIFSNPVTARTQAQTNLGSARRFDLPSRGFSRVRSAPAYDSDRLLSYSGYGIGGVGRRDKLPMIDEDVLGLVTVMGGVSAQEVETAQLSEGESRINPEMVEEFKLVLSPVDAEYGRGAGQIQVITRSESPPEPPVQLRSNFSETAFWKPHLLTDEDGSVSFEFEVPDSVTSWNVWVHAVTRDLKSGSAHREAQTVKDLMVRPYLPRFLREGDRAEIKVVVNNASDRDLEGRLDFDIVDPATGESILEEFGLTTGDATGKPFTVAAEGGANLTFPIKTPSRIGQVAFRVMARSGDFSDGELRPIPVLPGRMHLMQSRFVTLKDTDRRVIRFEDLARDDDPTRIDEQMVVTLDAQLFYSVLSALPYLVDYPYECTEQTLNRFVSTGILSSLYSQYPAIAKMAQEFSSRETQFEQWADPDPNRKMMLEETPWLRTAQGGTRPEDNLIKVLDSNIAKAQRQGSLSKLAESQTSSGGFPWWAGGPPSPYMTLYILNGLSKAMEFGVEVPGGITSKAWGYMHRHYLDDIVSNMVSCDCGWEFVTFLNYVLSNYPELWYQHAFNEDERREMLDFSFRHWRSHSPLLKGYLALTLKRMGRPDDAMLVWKSVMDSAKTEKDQGTFWAPEDRAWLWYNDTIETHAFAVRTEMDLTPDDPKLDGLVQWLFLNKKMNHWKSTRATAEVIYSLAHYLKETGQLGVREDATVTAGHQRTAFVFEPDIYTGKKNQIVIPGDKIDPETTSEITVEKTGKGQMFASASWHFSTEKLPDEERGDYLKLSRRYFKRVYDGKEYSLSPLEEGAALKPGDEVEVHLSLESKHPMEYVHLRDPRGAGFEPSSNLSKHKRDMGIVWYEEIRDSGTNFFFEHLPQGEYTFKYRIRAATAGTFKVAPATVQPMYAPEFAAYSTGAQLEIR